ncbi:MAG: DUF6498-containing protein [Chthoniobacterales bacterium]
MPHPAAPPRPTVTRSLALPSLAQHLREFAARPGAWGVFGRNLIPVVGIFFFGWSASLSVFNYWFDGLSALAAIIAVIIPRALRESRPNAAAGGIGAGIINLVLGVFTWIILVAVVGLPYWIVLIPLHDLLLNDDLRRQIAQSPGLWFTFGSLAAGHLWKAMRVGYEMMPEDELKQRARWDIYLLVLRAMAMFVMAAHGLTFVLVPFMSLLLTYFEIWPERVLGAVFGDPSRLYEYDPEKPASTRRR